MYIYIYILNRSAPRINPCSATAIIMSFYKLKLLKFTTTHNDPNKIHSNPKRCRKSSQRPTTTCNNPKQPTIAQEIIQIIQNNPQQPKTFNNIPKQPLVVDCFCK